MKLALFFPHLHICLHQISSVILLPTQSSKLLLQLCTIIFPTLNKSLTLYHHQTSLLTPPSMSYMTALNSTNPSTGFLAGFPLKPPFTMKNDYFLPLSGSFLLINYLSTHEPCHKAALLPLKLLVKDLAESLWEIQEENIARFSFFNCC